MITTMDVRSGCDVLRAAYDASGGVDGRVSIEVDPRLAQDANAPSPRPQLWWLVDRPNLFIKIPATKASCRPSPSACPRASANVT
jgi:transaldolase